MSRAKPKWLPGQSDTVELEGESVPEGESKEGRKERYFIVPPSDAQGRSQQLVCLTMPGVARMMDKLLQTAEYPFRTRQDVMRWCITRGCEWLVKHAELHGPTRSVLREVYAIGDVLIDEEFRLAFEDVWPRADLLIAHYLADGAYGEAGRLLSIMKLHIDQMPEGYWKARHEGAWRGRMGEFEQARRRPKGE